MPDFHISHVKYTVFFFFFFGGGGGGGGGEGYTVFTMSVRLRRFGLGGGVYCFHVVRPSATFWFFNILKRQ